MCGIIGVTGSDHTLDVLLEGLSRLEYRGYDSAGIALITTGSDDKLWRGRSAHGTRSLDELTKRRPQRRPTASPASGTPDGPPTAVPR